MEPGLGTALCLVVLQAGNIANISSTMVNLVLILLMSQVYTSLAEKLTRWGESDEARAGSIPATAQPAQGWSLRDLRGADSL